MIRLAIAGAGGRMGRVLARTVHGTPGCEVAGGLEAKASPFIGSDIGDLAGLKPLGIKVTDDPHALIGKVDGIIDFTVPHATLSLLAVTAAAGLVHVIGTTGIDEAGEEKIKAASAGARIVKSGNMSLGINLLAALVRKTAASLGPEFDIEILEVHHRSKIDAPSGTALLLGEAAAQGRKLNLASRSVRSRDGITGPRPQGDIGFAALRGGSVIGEHMVMFAGPAERIELSHKAESRDLFARGAVEAALWASSQAPGLYSMQHVLGME